MKKTIYLILVTVLLSCTQKENCSKNTYQCGKTKYSIPFIDNLLIDGKFDEWDSLNSFNIKLFANYLGAIPLKKDFSSNVKLAWNNDGLAILVNVCDDSIIEDPSKDIFMGDCIELFMCDTNGGKDMVQFIIAPNICNENNKSQIVKWDFRGNRKTLENEMKINLKSEKTNLGYQMEILLPLDQVGVKALENNEISFQIYVNDKDNANSDKKTSLQWHFINDTYLNTLATYQLLLSKKNSPEVNYSIKSYFQDFDSIVFKIFTDKKYDGQKISLINNNKKIYESVINSEIKSITFPKSVIDSVNPVVCAYIDTQLIENINTKLIFRKHIDTENYPFEQFIRTMKYNYSLNPPPENGVLFIGHSHIRFWITLKDDMGDLPVYNNGFGGSQTVHVLHYINDIVIPYKPKIIVYFEGANDLHTDITVTGIANNTEKFVDLVHEKLPKTKILILACPDALLKGRNELVQLDSLHKQISEKYDFVEQVILKDVLTNKSGEFMQNIKRPDNTHMTQYAYSFFAVPIKKRLEEIVK